jgi:hypothetical protein
MVKICFCMAAFLYKWFLVSSSLAFFAFSPEIDPHQENNQPAAVAPHPFYISVTEISQNVSEKTLEISCKLIAEDFEVTLEKAGKQSLDLSSEQDKGRLDRLIPEYMAKHLQLAVDGKATPLQYVGYEKEKESVYVYYQVTGVSSLKKLDLTNSILRDFQDDQINIIHVTVKGKRQSTKLDFPAVQASFQF